MGSSISGSFDLGIHLTTIQYLLNCLVFFEKVLRVLAWSPS